MHFTPKGGVTYRRTSTHSFYVNVGGGVEVPAGNETDPVPPDTLHAINLLLDPATSTTLEMGTKQLFGFGTGSWRGTFVYDVAVYWLQVRNDFIPYRNGRFYFTAGKTQRMGIELGARIELVNGVSFEGALTVSRNRYLEYKIDSVYYNSTKVNIFADYKDNSVAGVPDAFYSVAVKYAPAFSSVASLRVSVQGMSSYVVDDPNLYTVPSWCTLNAMLNVHQIHLWKGGLSVSGFFGVQNLLNRKYIGSAWINPDLNARGEPIYIEPGLPRNVVGSLSLKAAL
jgi:outer membrane receptor protein involved in Fe transport